MSENVNIKIGPLFEHLTVAFIILKLCKVIEEYYVICNTLIVHRM